MPSKCFASWASPNWTRPPRRRDKNRSCSDQPQNPPPYLLGVTGHHVKHALEGSAMTNANRKLSLLLGFARAGILLVLVLMMFPAFARVSAANSPPPP